jgi:hypothetical protein
MRGLHEALRTAILLALMLPCAFIEAAGDDTGRATLAAGERLPRPPRQDAAWTPPKTELPEALITATKTLFDLGLADPRGCEYRQFAIANDRATDWHGWVIPASDDAARPFAVCWDGLVHPVAKVGDRADIRADVRAAIKRDKELIAKDDGFLDPSRRSPDLNADRGAGIRHDMLTPLKVCLLLRLGEEELARGLWSAWKDRLEPVNNTPEFVAKPFLILADNWSRYAFERALSAHVDHDDRLALIAIREYVPIVEGVQAQAVILSVQRYRPLTEGEQQTLVGGGEVSGLAPDGQVAVHLTPDPLYPDLLADQERRARESAVPRPAVVPGDRAGRIAALIRDLEEINDTPSCMIYGSPDFRHDPTCQKLVAEGEAAVLPLLDAVERDDRLTRIFWETRGLRFITHAYEPAYAALETILGTTEFQYELGYDHALRHATVTRMRAYWERNKDVPIEMRWYRKLADDGGSVDQWLDATANIVAPVDPSTPQARRLRGDGLRGRTDANLSNLLAKRIAAMSPPGGEGEKANLHKAVRMARYLARWDASAARPVLQRLSAYCLARANKFDRYESPTRAYAELIALRAHCGDIRALDEYAVWLRAQPVSVLESAGTALFEPLWRHADQPAMRDLAAWLLADPKSPWTVLIVSDPESIAKLASSPLIGIASFRNEILKCLANRTVLGEATPGPRIKNVELASRIYLRDSMMAVKIGGKEQSERYDGEDTLAKPGATSVFRVCDYYASKLNVPDRCQIYWPEKDRDAAVARCRAFLERYGARFRALEWDETVFSGPFDSVAALAFPLLDHPATPDEVERGLAVFSLGAGADARVVPLAKRPLWVAWKKSPRATEGQPEGGMVYQAEEVREQGKLRRYYGFVGDSVVARVSADDVMTVPGSDQLHEPPYP